MPSPFLRPSKIMGKDLSTMNNATDLAAADAYFAGHPQARRWREELDDEARTGALRVAELDILCTVGTAVLPVNDEVRHAWFEQALYLLTHPEIPDDGGVLAESVEGVGSRTYSGKKRFLAPRAEQLLVPYLRSLTVSILRG